MPPSAGSPDGVLKAVVRRSGVDEVAAAELLQVSQPLELRRVDDLDEQRVERHRAVDGIVEHLAEHTEPEASRHAVEPVLLTAERLFTRTDSVTCDFLCLMFSYRLVVITLIITFE